jgi:hypothetical protein
MRARLCIIAAGHLAGALIIGPAVYAGPPPDAAAELRALEQKWVDAQIRRDAAAVAELLEDQFMFVAALRSRSASRQVAGKP